MLETLILRNFQAHRYLEVSLDPLVTTIVGRTDIGKSAIIRALYWLCMGRPLGHSFITHGKTKCRVELHVDGHILFRQRGKKSAAIYKLDGEPFQAMGTDIPEEIANLLNVGEVNFQRQLDAPFWMTDAPAKLSKNLNAIVNLDGIDKALHLAKRKVSTARVSLQVADERTATLRKRVDSLAWVEDFHADLQQITSKQESLDGIRRTRQELMRLLQRANTLLGQSQGLEVAELEGITVLEAARSLRSVHLRRVRLSKLVDRITHHQDVVSRELPDISGMSRMVDTLDDLHNRKVRLTLIIARVKAMHEKLSTLSAKLSESQSKLNKVGACPLCRQPLKSSPSSVPICTYRITRHRAAKRGVRRGIE